ncbi:hypothetical protein J2810_004591 [Chryseobacterium rhizosphaerae]|uniref:hypothetical protein n=1 Tax=Chryseobacterium rhizosphaerae TaxID=395937 RepID=UPI00285D3DD8|nr:hypothetical protein [Chryseobacterium rhizosphaerae]MDR6548501.1 hypothetical protein [Chryseobacterium rhizosphaerae]
MIKPIELKATLSQLLFQKTIITISWEQIHWCEQHPEDFETTFFPLEITEDRLKNLGFILNEVTDLYGLLGFAFKKEKYDQIIILSTFATIEVKYIHHIQDIIHAITGQIVKLDKDAR